LAVRKRKSWKHLSLVFIGSFLIAAAVGISSELLMRKTSSFWVAIVLLLTVIGVHIIFDIIGIAATAAHEAPHHARAANRVKGGRQAVYLVRHADLVANMANDVVGDVTGTLSGVLAAAIVIDIVRLYPNLGTKEIWVTTVVLALVASITVTGKAIGKSLAIQEANQIIAWVGTTIASFEQITGWSLTGPKKRGGKKDGTTRKNT
jgi:CBS domain containing-hemolysin-like protein